MTLKLLSIVGKRMMKALCGEDKGIGECRYNVTRQPTMLITLRFQVRVRDGDNQFPRCVHHIFTFID